MLIEVVVGAAILATVALAFFGSTSALGTLHERNMLYIKGDLLAEEGIEAMRLVKDSGWNNLASLPSGTPRYLLLGSAGWSITTTPEIVDGLFYRTVKVYQVFRDASANISVTGTPDPNTILLESNVAWSYHTATSTVTYKAYVTNM